MRRLVPAVLVVLCTGGLLHATIFGSIRGLIHDPQHRPIAGAQITIAAQASDWKQTVTSNEVGEFHLDAVPVGVYRLELTAPGFATQTQLVTVTSGTALNLHFALSLPQVHQTVEVRGEPSGVNPQSSTTETVVSRQEISRAPGADRANSMAMITDFVPGAYIVHNQLHVRGGHEAMWLLDGVPVPNTNIASNVGPQFDPKDIDYLEVQRGGMGAESGERTFGAFNVVTRSGFERTNEGQLVASFGSFRQTDDQLNFGSHTDRFAYYGSIAGNRTDLGLETPAPEVLHDLGAGLSAFGSMIFNKTTADQLRLVAAVRGDHYQVPNTPEQQAVGIRDVDNERDAFANFSWVHSSNNGVLVTVSPFVHFNRAHYVGGPQDAVSPDDNRSSTYAGGVVTLGVMRGRHNLRLGMQSFAEQEDRALALRGPASTFADRQRMWGNVGSAFVEEQFKAASWLALNGGLRFTRFAGALHETATDPRVGAALTVPRVGWVLRGFYGRYYQAPPLMGVGGPVLELAAQQGFGFLPLRGERDEQHEVGLTVPVAGWTFDLTHFRTGAKNFFDHDVLGNSNIFFPLTIARVRIRGWEATVRSPRVAGRLNLHAAYSRQWVQGRGGVTGGLTDFAPPTDAYYYLDHDQRDTLAAGGNVSLPWNSWAAANLAYGSGFLDGDGPAHLPSHTTFDVSVGKSFEKWSVAATALNLTNRHYLLDNSNTFGGTHFANPRELVVQMRYRFKY